jgi:hypothetical protein
MKKIEKCFQFQLAPLHHGPRPGSGAREFGPIPWDATTIRHATLNGHLELLKWARENGCPWYGGAG